MRIPDRDMALLCKIHIGITRSGQAVLETEKVENVLGDVEHKACIEMMAVIAAQILENLLKAHLGEEMTPEQVKEAVSNVVPTDDLLSFFDRHNTIGYPSD